MSFNCHFCAIHRIDQKSIQIKFDASWNDIFRHFGVILVSFMRHSWHWLNIRWRGCQSGLFAIDPRVDVPLHPHGFERVEIRLPVPLFDGLRPVAGNGQRDAGVARIRHGELSAQSGMQLPPARTRRKARLTPLPPVRIGRFWQRRNLRRKQHQRRTTPSNRRI